MPGLDRELTDQFHRWEVHGRGGRVFDAPVYPEPPFVPFYGHYLRRETQSDDGRRPGFLRSLVQRAERTLSTEQLQPPVIPLPDDEPEPELLIRDSLLEIHASLPADFDVPKDAVEHFLSNLSFCREPIAFELLGIPNRVTTQFVASALDAPLLRRQLQAHFPGASFQARESALEKTWEGCAGDLVLVTEFGLGREFMFPLAGGKADPFVGIIGALSELQLDEFALFQVLFQPTEHPWAKSVERAVTNAQGKPFFVDSADLVRAAQAKVSRPLYAAVVRLALRAGSKERTWQISRDVAGSLRVFANPEGNHLVPLKNEGYDFKEHVDDMLNRQSRRSGMLLNSEELIGFVHLPSSAISSPVFARDSGKTKGAPTAARQSGGVLLGSNEHVGELFPVRLTTEQRLRHCHVIGASGTGKSTLLFNLIQQDIENGEGVAVLDPHGDLIERILGAIPEERIEDVILLDPADGEYSVGFNILSAHSDLEKTLLASDLVSVFQRLSTSWGDQLGSVLQNAILAFLESPDGGTLADLRRFLIEPAFREKVLRTVRDPDIVYYWRKAFPQLTGNRSIGPVLTRLDTFLSPKPIRYMVSQSENRLDFGEILDTGKIFLAKLSQGQIGKENSYLLGSLLLAKFQQLVMGRQAQEAASRRPYFLYADEFHNFITPSLAEILSGARKYGLALTLAHQELHQLERNQDVKSAVLSNPYTRVVFRVGDSDARSLEGGFSFFETKDFQNLETGRAICRVEKADGDFNLSVPLPAPIDPGHAKAVRGAVIAASRRKYATLRSEVEAALLAKLNSEDGEPPPKTKPAARPVQAKEAKPTPVPSPTVSEKEKLAVEAAPVPAEAPKLAKKPVEVVSPPAEPPRDLGRGGEQHKAVQERLQKEAHTLGFSAQIEKQLKKESNCAADLLLQKGEVTIAVEITITTTTDHEFGNVKKCLAGGFSRVAVISPSPERLKYIAAAVQAGLGSEAATKVSYHSPDEFIAELRKIAAEVPKPEPPPLPTEQVVHGWKVRRHGAALSEEQREANEGNTLNIMLSALRPK